MKRSTCCALLISAALAAPAWAQPNATEGWFQPFLGAGFTFGGQTLLAATITPVGTSTHYQEDISAGAGLDLRAGLQLHAGNLPLALKVAVAHHVDGASGINGWAAFRRNPLELGLSWRLSPSAAIGAGLRHSTRAKYHDQGGTCNGVPCSDENIHYKGSTGAYIEAEWRPTVDWGLQIRAVHESFTVNEAGYVSEKFYGDHVGFMGVYYFN